MKLEDQSISADQTSENSPNLDELLKSEARYRAFIENLPEMFYAVEPQPPYRPIYISPAFAGFGYPLEEWREDLGLWVRALHAEDREQVLAKTEAAIRAGDNLDYEYRLIGSDGKIYWVRDRSSFIRDRAGNAVCWQGILFDITERKQIEADLRENEERYRQMFEKNQSLKLLIDGATGEIVEANPAACRFYGYSRDEMMKKNIADINTLSAEEIQSEMKRAADEHLNYFIFKHRLASGAVRDVEIHSSPIKWSNRNLLYSIIYDITERKQSEDALIESEARYRDLFEKANDIIYVTDLKGNYLAINKAAERIFGYTRAEALNLNHTQIAAPEQLDFVKKMLAKKLGGESKTAYEVECVTKDGRRIMLEVNSTTLYQNDVPVAIQGVARDITERKATEQALRQSEEEYRELFENANDLIYTHDLQGNFTSLNRAGERTTGFSREEALQINVAQIVAPEFLAETRARIASKVDDELPTAYELEIITKSGSRVALELSTRLIFHNGTPVGVQGIGRDISERKRAEENLKASEASYRLLGENIFHQVWTAQPDGKLDYVNGRTLDYFRRSFDEIIGEGWQSVVHPDDLPNCIKSWTHSLETGELYETEFRLLRHDGAYRWFTARATAGLDADGKIIKWFGTNTDVEDEKTVIAKLDYFARHDALTDLPNRAEFMNHLKSAIERTAENRFATFAVLFLDLDRFKIINDSLGHTVGDKLLVAIAERLKAGVRPGDVVARLGGDEFTVLLNRTGDLADVARVADRLQKNLSAPFKLDNYEVFTSASIGVIVSDDVRRTPEDFLRDADAAMYRAKESGKARYEIFDRAMHVQNLNLLQLENDLRRAVENDEFIVYYQPIVSLTGGEIYEFEALIRWRHPEHGLIAPNDFISLAEETGLIIPIGEWILRESCRQTAEWQNQFSHLGKKLAVSVNLSAKQLMHPTLVEQVGAILAETGLAAASLKLEVTESTVMEHSEIALEVLHRLKSLGIELSTDDFGTGYSSLSYLHRFPFERLKIDRSFISKMDTDEKSAAIVKTILLLGQNLKIQVVAEGIETAPQLEMLIADGCLKGQGYLFSKPINAAEAEQFLLENSENVSGHFAAFPNIDNRQLVELDKIQ